MSVQPSLFDPEPVARARTTDPETSHAAAASLDADHITHNQAAVLGVLGECGPATDTALVALYDARVAVAGLPLQSPSGIRTRRKELVAKGRVRDTGGRVRLETGRLAIEWAVAP